MRIRLNGETRTLSGPTTVSELLASLGVRGRIAVEINGELVPRSAHASHVLADGDCVEIVQAIGGGAFAPNRGASDAEVRRAGNGSGTST